MSKTPVPVFEEIRRKVAGMDLACRGDHYVCGPRREDGGYALVSKTVKIEKITVDSK